MKSSSLVVQDELRDIYSIGLKTLVLDVPEETGRAVANRLIKRLLGGVGSDKLEASAHPTTQAFILFVAFLLECSYSSVVTIKWHLL